MVMTRLVGAHSVASVAVTVISLFAYVTGTVVITWAGICVVIIGASFIVHETGHAVAFRLLAGVDATAILRVTPSAADLIWRSTGVLWRDLAIIVAGPVAPLVVTIPVIVATSGNLVVLFAAVVASVSHLLSLVLRNADGGQLRELIRTSREP